MFKKIVSQLSFSPALVGQLGFYAKRLRKEQVTRRLGLVFTALALVVQSLVVFQAPEPANAANANDMVVGGLGYGSNLSLNNLLAPYDRNDRNLRDVFNHFGITRAELASMKFSTVKVGTVKSYGFENRAGSTAISIPGAGGGQVTTLYGRLLSSWGWKQTDNLYAYVGHSANLGWFAVLRSCGNLVTIDYPPTPPPTPPPAPANIITSKTAVNVTRGNVDATKVAAQEKDRLNYTITAKNTGGTDKVFTMQDQIGEVLKYSKLVDAGGGVLSGDKSTLTWPAINITPGMTVTKVYSVQMNDDLTVLTGAPTCSMLNRFDNKTVDVPVACKPPKISFEPLKTAVNVTRGNADATKVMAQEGNKITYTISVKNTGNTTEALYFKDDVSDVLQYATLIDTGGGKLDAASKYITWPGVAPKPGQTASKKYTVQMNDDLTSSTTSCTMVNGFEGQRVTVRVDCKTPPAEIVLDKTATNVSQGNVDASKVVAQESDRITYTLTVENKGGTAQDFSFVDSLSDVLEYAKIVDTGGGTFDEDSKKLSWPTVNLKPGQKEIRAFSVQILPEIPATPQGLSDGTSYDCQVDNTFFTSYVSFKVNCPAPKVIEEIVPELPQTGPRENVMFGVILFAVVLYFYLRSRQLNTEVRLIRRDLNGGTI